MSNKVSLFDLYEIKKKKEAKVNSAFNIILEACYKKIKSIAMMGAQSLYYSIPPIQIGFPLYNYNDCMSYITKTLKKNGLFVAVLPYPNHNMIYISWKLEDVSPSISNDKKRLLIN
jgi:hypothetical protein